MGIIRAVTQWDFSRIAATIRVFWRGWDEIDRMALKSKLEHPGPYWNSGILRLTAREYRALQKADYPGKLTIWCEGYGLLQR